MRVSVKFKAPGAAGGTFSLIVDFLMYIAAKMQIGLKKKQIRTLGQTKTKAN